MSAEKQSEMQNCTLVPYKSTSAKVIGNVARESVYTYKLNQIFFADESASERQNIFISFF